MKKNFLKEWTPKQFKDVEKAIAKFIRSRYWIGSEKQPDKDIFIANGAKTFNQISDVLGLAYTSTSSFAGYWPCNDNLYLNNEKTFWLVGFALDNNSFVHAIFWDKDENEISFPIN